MPPRFVLRSTAWAALALLLAAGIIGCGPRSATSSPPSTPNRETGAAALTALTPSQKRSAIASSFPAEVPVVSGRITRANSQGDTAWDYEVVVGQPPEVLLGWYRDAYVNRGWGVLREGEWDGPTGRGPFIELRKGDAESSVRISATDAQGLVSSATVIVGFGPILQTQ